MGLGRLQDKSSMSLISTELCILLIIQVVISDVIIIRNVYMDVEELLPKPPYYYQPLFISVSYIILFLTLWIIIMGYIYSLIMKTEIENDWANQRCKGGIFMGGKENLDFCIKQIMASVVSKSTSPLTYGATELTTFYAGLSQQIQSARNMLAYIRASITNIVRDILGRTMGVFIPIQVLFITINDMFYRAIAIFTTAMYMGIATILTMKKILETILTFIIVILISLASLIVIMWIFPFTWASAILFTAIFVSISIPLLMFVKTVSKVTDLGIPSLPKKPHVCFDKYTAIKLSTGGYCPIFRLKLGEILADGSKVTAKLKLSVLKSEMYYLNGIFVTGSHLVKWKTTWIPVSNHPNSIKVPSYTKPYVYCINTTNGLIKIGDMIFTDWDEMLEEDFSRKFPHSLVELNNGQKKIKDINIGDILIDGQTVTGIAKLLNKTTKKNKKEKQISIYTE